MATLPTRIRQNIRDLITSETSPLVLKTNALATTLGFPIVLNPEWAILWNTLAAFYPDAATFVPSTALAAITWCEAFSSWLSDETNEEDVDRLLDGLGRYARLEISIEISESLKRPSTVWQATKCVFVIALPKAALPGAQVMLAGFSTDLLNLFGTSPEAPTSGSTKIDLGTEDAEDWADLGQGVPENRAAVPGRSYHALVGESDGGEDSLPQVAIIQRPEVLTLTPPYWMIVRQEGNQRVVVQGSHAPSLACLDEYLRRWCRTEMTRVDRPPMIAIKMQESAFGMGLMGDVLILDAIRGKEINALLVLVFVEKMLGYSSVPLAGSAGNVWEFKRTRGFRS